MLKLTRYQEPYACYLSWTGIEWASLPPPTALTLTTYPLTAALAYIACCWVPFKRSCTLAESYLISFSQRREKMYGWSMWNLESLLNSEDMVHWLKEISHCKGESVQICHSGLEWEAQCIKKILTIAKRIFFHTEQLVLHSVRGSQWLYTESVDGVWLELRDVLFCCFYKHCSGPDPNWTNPKFWFY